MARALRTSADRACFPRPSVAVLTYASNASVASVQRNPGTATPTQRLMDEMAEPTELRGLPHNTPSTQARDELGIELRSFYRTSPPAADRWVHRARYEVCFPRPFQVPQYAIDATRYEKRRRNAATRRSRPSRPR